MKSLALDGQKGLAGIDATIEIGDGELEDAVPGQKLDLKVTLRSLSPVAAELRDVGSPLSEEKGAFTKYSPSSIKLRAGDNRKVDGLHVRIYDVAALVKEVDPGYRPLRFDFGNSGDCTVSIPVGARDQAKDTDPAFVTVKAPAEVSIGAFERSNHIDLELRNNYSDYDIKVLGYRIENSQGFLVSTKVKLSPDKVLPIRHGRFDTLVVPLATDDWKTLVTRSVSPTMSVKIDYSDGCRVRTLLFPALAFKVRYGWTLTLVFCLLGACLGALFRLALPESAAQRASERSLNPGARAFAWSLRSFLSLVAGVLGWLLSSALGVEFAVKGLGVSLLTADTPIGSLFIGILTGLIPPSRYGSWLYEKLTGGKLPQDPPATQP